jgi:hypothetical protein
MVHNKILDQQSELQAAEEVQMYFEIDNGMRLKNPCTQNEAPSTYVYMKPQLTCGDKGMKFLQTPTVIRNSYPTWNYRSNNFVIPLNQKNMEFIRNGGALEFEVFHKAQATDKDALDVTESNHMIGVAFVPLKPLIEGSGNKNYRTL